LYLEAVKIANQPATVDVTAAADPTFCMQYLDCSLCYRTGFRTCSRRTPAMSEMNGMTIQRDTSGRLLPGSRLNPGGRPRATIEDIRERLLPYMAESVETRNCPA
jgi:hypothetical protein